MTDREKFQKSFEHLHASPDTITEVISMVEENKVSAFSTKRRISNIAVAAIVLILILSTGTAAYAMNIGGIQRKIQIWTYGDQTDATIVIDNGSYTLDYTDADGNPVHRGGGGVTYDFWGRERPLTEEELLEHLNSPEVRYKDDGSVWVYYFDQKIDITDKFENGVCFVKLQANNETLYLTVEYQNGYSYSSKGYVQPDKR